MAPGLVRLRKPAIDPAMSDEALVALARHDRQAFGVLYDRYVELIYRYCLARLRDREEAEDATSLIFARAFAGIATQRGPSFRSWLFSIAHNAVADAHRGASVSAPLAQIAHLPAPGPTVEDLAAAGERRDAVRRALGRLTPEQRQIVELRMAGMTGPEIARALGRSHDSVRTTQRRALAQIRSLLGITPDMREGRDAS